MGLLRDVVWAAAGFSATPALDYAWHAWIAHGRGDLPTRADHLEHHRTAHTVGDPWAEMRDNAKGVGGAALGIAAVLSPALGVRPALALASGLAAGYVAITLSHARMHVRAPRTAFEAWMWRFHFHHHYGDAKKNFGLTSPLFDFVFGTVAMPEVVELPEAALPTWWTGEHPGFRVKHRCAPNAA